MVEIAQSNIPVAVFDGESRHWIAINEASLAHAPFPMKWPIEIVPTPQYIFGFNDENESYAAQDKLLNLPIDQVGPLMASWAARGDVVMIRMVSPKPPTEGPTMWMEE